MDSWLLTKEEGNQAISNPANRKLTIREVVAIAQDAKTKRKLVEWLEKEVFYVDKRGYIALKPKATENWQALREEVGME